MHNDYQRETRVRQFRWRVSSRRRCGYSDWGTHRSCVDQLNIYIYIYIYISSIYLSEHLLRQMKLDIEYGWHETVLLSDILSVSHRMNCPFQTFRKTQGHWICIEMFSGDASNWDPQWWLIRELPISMARCRRFQLRQEIQRYNILYYLYCYSRIVINRYIYSQLWPACSACWALAILITCHFNFVTCETNYIIHS